MKKHIELLWNFEITANEDTFISIYGSHYGQHLWSKFKQYHSSILFLWGYLDTQNRELLIKHLETL